MPKKSNALAVRGRAVEVLAPLHATQSIEAAVRKMVDEKIAEMMGGGDAIFKPFFRTRAIEDAIRKEQTVVQQRKWRYYFEKWGCLICGSKAAAYNSLGMCATCHARTAHRLATCMRRAEAERPDSPAVRDLQDVAKDAVKRR